MTKRLSAKAVNKTSEIAGSNRTGSNIFASLKKPFDVSSVNLVCL